MTGIALNSVVAYWAIYVTCIIDKFVWLHTLGAFVISKTGQTVRRTVKAFISILIRSSWAHNDTLISVQFVRCFAFLTCVSTCATLTAILTFLTLQAIFKFSF